MNLQEQLLVQIYAQQRIYLSRMLEMLCAMQEQLETGAEPTGLLFSMIGPEAEKLAADLADMLKESNPQNNPFMRDQPISPEVFRAWLENPIAKEETDR